MPTYSFPTTKLPFVPEQTGFPAGTNLVVITPEGREGQTPISLLPSSSIYFNVKKYGATGNGTTDDRASIQAAINACGAGGGGIVYFPPGTYYVSSALLISDPGVILQGDFATVKSVSGSEAAKVIITASNTVVEGIVFDGAYTSGSGSIDQSFGLIDVLGASDITPVSNVRIRNCSFTYSKAIGVRLKGNIDGVRITDNEFARCFCSIFGNAYTTSTTLKNVFIAENRFRANWGSGNESGAVKIQGDDTHSLAPFNIVVDGNIVDDGCGQMGIELWNFCTRSAVRKNQINGVEFGISIDQGSYVTVSDNVVSKCSYTGIELASICNHCTVSDNVVSCYSSGSTRGGVNGIVSSNVSCFLNVFQGNSVAGCNERAINLIGNDRCSVLGNTVVDSQTCLYLQDCNRINVRENNLYGPCTYHIFLDVSGANCTDIDITSNYFYGAAISDNIIIYDAGNVKTLTNLRIAGNNSINATFAGYFPINRLPDAQLPNFQVLGNFYIEGAGKAVFSDYNTSSPAPYAASIQRAGITVAAKKSIAAAASGSARWVKVMSVSWGNTFFLQAHFYTTNTSNGEGSAVNAIVAAGPYGNGSTVTLLPSGDFSGNIEEIIYSNPSSGATHEVWLKLAASSYNYTVDCYVSDFPTGVVTSPSFVTTEPTWASNSYRVKTAPNLNGTQCLQPAGIHTQRYIASSSRGVISDVRGRMHVRGAGVVGGTSSTRVAIFERDDGSEAFGVEDTGRILIPQKVKIGAVAADIKSVCSGAGTLDFGTIGANSEFGLDLYVAGAVTTGTPTVELGWASALPTGISVKQAFVNATDSVSIILQNITGSGIAVDSRILRATVIQY